MIGRVEGEGVVSEFIHLNISYLYIYIIETSKEYVECFPFRALSEKGPITYKMCVPRYSTQNFQKSRKPPTGLNHWN
jgi:hypothetical protein